ncbi:uncharacterized protein LOC143533832 [Bidens hawaiensis]|uniref:uncharacterized protein LOC143533832 n=1 Tax=Bidens hawaiensis TaxID=980011 RepID=UPI00404B344F
MPVTIESAIEFARYLMESMIRNQEEERKNVAEMKRESDCKRRFEKGKEVSSTFNRPLCKNYGKRHKGRCLKPTPKVDVRKFDLYSTCNFCKRLGYKEEDCMKKLIICFTCGEKGHFNAECTKKRQVTGGASGSGARNDGKKVNARVFTLNTQKPGELPDVITRANQSFTDYKLCNLLNKSLAKLNNHYEVETANGNLIRISEVLNCYISLAGYELQVQGLPMELARFDVILGMEWLVANQARILCNEKAIDLLILNKKIIRIVGDKEAGRIEIISKIKASHCLGKGCLAFMAYITKEPEPKKMNEDPVVSEFKDVFPDELHGIPPDREVEFRIDLISGTAPIAKSPS